MSCRAPCTGTSADPVPIMSIMSPGGILITHPSYADGAPVKAQAARSKAGVDDPRGGDCLDATE